MPEVQEVCEDVIAAAEGSLACAVVDLATGTTVAAAYGPDTELNANRIDLVSVAATDMFRGRLIRQFHRAWSSGNSVPEHFVREVQMATANSYQFISVVPARNDTLFVLITDRNVSLGLGWMSVHQALEQLEKVAGPVRAGASGASARHDSTRAKPPADASPTLQRPRPPAPDTPPVPASRVPKRPPVSQPPPASARPSGPRTAPPPALEPPPPAVVSPPEPEPATQARPAGHSQRTYRGVPIDDPPPSQGRPQGDVPMGPRGRMFNTRRGADKPKH